MKLFSPFGNVVHSLTQTTHGESASNPNDLTRQKAEDWSAVAGTPVYAGCDGVIVNVTSSAGSYMTLDPGASCPFYIPYVHVKAIVGKDEKVVRGQQIAITIAPYGHLHLGFKNKNGLAPHPEPMDYLDRSTVIQTSYQEIASIWFVNGSINWGLFQDLHIPGSVVIEKGERVRFTSETNIRTGNGTDYPIQDMALSGSVAEIVDGPRPGNGYTWYDCRFLSGSGWCISKHMEKTSQPVSNPDGSIPEPQPPVDPCAQRVKETEELFKGRILKLSEEYDRRVADLNRTHSEALQGVLNERKEQERAWDTFVSDLNADHADELAKVLSEKEIMKKAFEKDLSKMRSENAKLRKNMSELGLESLWQKLNKLFRR